MSLIYDKHREDELFAHCSPCGEQCRGTKMQRSSKTILDFHKAVAEMGSFTRAADQLAWASQGGASTAIRRTGRRCRCRRLPAPDDAQRAVDGRRTGISCTCPRIYLLTLMTLHLDVRRRSRGTSRGVYASIFRPRWRAQRSCRPYRISCNSIQELELEGVEYRIGKSIWFKEGFDGSGANCPTLPIFGHSDED